MLRTGRACAVRVPCIHVRRRTWHARARGGMRRVARACVRARACVHMHCSRLAAGGRREAPEAARRRPRRSLQPRAPAAPHGKPPLPRPPTPASLVAGRSCPSLTGTPNPNHRTSRSPSASTRTRASRTMSTRDKHSCAHRAQARTRFTSFARCTPRGCRTLSGISDMHQHAAARAARAAARDGGAPGRSR